MKTKNFYNDNLVNSLNSKKVSSIRFDENGTYISVKYYNSEAVYLVTYSNFINNFYLESGKSIMTLFE